MAEALDYTVLLSGAGILLKVLCRFHGIRDRVHQAAV